MISTGPISKSGMNHRLRKLNELADKIRNGEQIEISIGIFEINSKIPHLCLVE